MSSGLDHEVSRYALNVIEGKIIAAPLVRAQCERHLRDLETGGDRGLWFDGEAATRFLNFTRFFNHTTGPLAGRMLEMEPWQVFSFGSLYGWKREDGFRRFRIGYNQIAKKNGKTTMAVLPALYGLTFDREGSPQVYAAATTGRQAGNLFEDARTQAQSSELRPLLDARHYEIRCPATNGVMRILTRSPDAADGFNPHVTIGDEVHRWRGRELGELIRKSMIARSQPIYWMITTAGDSLQSYCGEMRLYAEAVATGAVLDDQFFAFVSEPPASADPGDPTTWAMANPNLGVSVPEEEIRQLWQEARAIPGRLPGFLRFHCNRFTDGAEAWISSEVWATGGEPIEEDFLKRKPCYAGLDLSNTLDLSAYALAFPIGEEIFLLVRSFIATGGNLGSLADRARSDGADYVAWHSRGWLEQHHGGIDEARILERIKEDAARFDIREFAYDRWGMAGLRGELKNLFGQRFVEHGQGYASMSAPMKRFELKAMQGRIRHGGNEALARAVRNVFRESDAAENIKPSKAKSLGRIDPAVASIMALGRADAAAPKRRRAGDIAI
ncbi:terminase large subunit [Neomegalonema perideroedes]|uniref:terminase large subunit n=1 Tax=Neomegalonema perideroedes TaxID=217219 RepID=UPI00036374E5|nr:terminase TerL endonuclease subunit [Neomegalonema perideroedes]